MVASLLALEICVRFFFHPFEVTAEAIAITVPVYMIFILVLLLLLLYIGKNLVPQGLQDFFVEQLATGFGTTIYITKREWREGLKYIFIQGRTFVLRACPM